MRIQNGQEMERLDQKLLELARQIGAVRKSLATGGPDGALADPLDGNLQNLTHLVADTIGDVSHRLGRFNEILIELHQQPTA